MKYINTRTGAVIETPAEISGSDWERPEPERAEGKRQKEKPESGTQGEKPAARGAKKGK